MNYYSNKYQNRVADPIPDGLSSKELWLRGIEASKRLYEPSTPAAIANVTKL